MIDKLLYAWRLCLLYVMQSQRSLFRGPLVTETPWHGGFVRVYTSGYSEFIAADGRWFDCALAEARKIIPWHCLGTGAHGGSGGPQFYTSPMKLKHAKQYMIDQGHTLLYVDEPNATLFFKPKQ
jgi:hypothetical protein